MGYRNNDIEKTSWDGQAGDIPPCLIRVDKDGRLWHQGAEMTHSGINRLLMEHVELDDQGRYIIVFQGQRCLVDVEDTFFVIRRVERVTSSNGRTECFTITLNDESSETLDPSTLRQNEDHVPYAQIKRGRFPARFTRQSYYQLAAHVIEKDGVFLLPVGDREYRIA